MNYIIDPWVFYIIDLAGKLVVAGWIFLIMSAVVLLMGCSGDFDIPKNFIITNIAVFIISLAVVIFVPYKDARYQMLIASQLTVENVNNAGETVKDIADYIVERTKEITGEGS